MRKRNLLLLAAAACLSLAASARAEFRLEKNLKLDPGGRFVLDADAGSVSVTGSRESGANVVITSDRDDVQNLFKFDFEEGPGTARVTARKISHFSWPHRLSLHYEVRVPTNTQTEIRTGGGSIRTSSLRGEAELKTSGGAIEVSDLNGNLRANTSGGHIKLRELTGDVDVRTSGGHIEVSALEGPLRAHTSGGHIRIERVSGRVEAHTSGGSVRARFDRGNTHGGVLETSGGSIHVALDPRVNLELDASTSGGHVVSDIPIKVVGRISGRSLRGTLGSGGELLKLHTSGGSIHLGSL